MELLTRTIDDVKGFAVEKYGLPPDFVLTASDDMHAVEVTFQPALVEYVILEVWLTLSALAKLTPLPPRQIHIPNLASWMCCGVNNTVLPCAGAEERSHCFGSQGRCMGSR
jgi:hypothetical protein